MIYHRCRHFGTVGLVRDVGADWSAGGAECNGTTQDMGSHSVDLRAVPSVLSVIVLLVVPLRLVPSRVVRPGLAS